MRVSLVPAYEQCTAPNRTHGPPLAFPSCNPPAQASDFLTVGTPDANGASAESVGSVRIDVIVGAPGPPDDTDILIRPHITDVRCKPAVSTCGSANAAGGPDYTGELEGNATLRITDHWNGTSAGGGPDPATMNDIPFPFALSCTATPDSSTGSICKEPSTTCLGCFLQLEGKRTLAQLAQFEIWDGGADGRAATEDNTLFMVQGVFIP
jgi:hypothetical protein